MPQSKNPGSAIGDAPREALAHMPEMRTILETELQDRLPTGWKPRAILGRRLTWLFYFGDEWLRRQLINLFPPNDPQLRDAAWLGHLQYDQQPVPELTEALRPCYEEHIASLGRDDAPGDDATRSFATRRAGHRRCMKLEPHGVMSRVICSWSALSCVAISPRCSRALARLQQGRTCFNRFSSMISPQPHGQIVATAHR
jgi:hypothetical protein